MKKTTPQKIVNLEKHKKSLKSAGGIIVFIGIATVVINIILFIWKLAAPNTEISLIAVTNFTNTLFVSLIGVVYVILGRRILLGNDIYTRRYLIILLVMALPFFIFSLINLHQGEGLSWGAFIVFISILAGLYSYGKCLKNKEFKKALHYPKYVLNKKGWIISSIFVLIAFILTIKLDWWIEDKNWEEMLENSSDKQIVSYIVDSLKAATSFPQQMDDVTTFTDVTAEEGAIRYHYILSNSDGITEEGAKLFLKSSLCENSDIRSLLQQKINMEYSYVLDDIGGNYLISISEEDCLD